MLSEKRRKFVESYMICGNATVAAKEAGYGAPGQAGHRLLKSAEIQAELNQRVAADPKVRTREQWLEWLNAKMDSAEKDADQIKAAELFGKAGGWFAATKLEHAGKDGGPIQHETTVDRPHIAKMPPENLEKYEEHLGEISKLMQSPEEPVH